MSEPQFRRDDAGATRRRVTRVVVVLAVVALVAVAVMIAGGGHSPRRHGAGDGPGTAPTTTVASGAHVPPAGAHP